MRQFVLFFLLFAAPLFAADAGRGNLDGDGQEDCWTMEIDGGSGFSFATLKIETPCGAAPMTIEAGGSFGDFLRETELPAGVSGALEKSIVAILFREFEVREEGAIDDTFRLLLGKAPRWTAGAPRVPPDQVILRPHTLVSYAGTQHGELHAAGTCRGVEVFATKHGIALYDAKRDRTKWLYVANGVVEKLRWASIEGVRCAGRKLDVDLRGGTTISLVIDGGRTTPTALPSANSPGI